MNEDSRSHLVFPCEFSIKVFGVATDQFVTQVMGLIRKHIPEAEDACFRTRPSQDGKYLAITITVEAESQPQLDAIYQELTASPLILMAL